MHDPFNPFDQIPENISINRIGPRPFFAGDSLDEILPVQTAPDIVDPIPVEDWFADYMERFPEMKLEDIGEEYAEYLARVESENARLIAEWTLLTQPRQTQPRQREYSWRPRPAGPIFTGMRDTSNPTSDRPRWLR